LVFRGSAPNRLDRLINSATVLFSFCWFTFFLLVVESKPVHSPAAVRLTHVSNAIPRLQPG
jgi:hypothetical protein